MKNLWDQCKESFGKVAGTGAYTDNVIFCEASALVLPEREAKEAGGYLNLPLINFLEHKRDEGYQVHVYAVTPDMSCGNLKYRELDCEDLPFEVESHTDLVKRYGGLRRGLVIANQVSQTKDVGPLMHWHPHDPDVMAYLDQNFSMA